jgi:hypothetical protein
MFGNNNFGGNNFGSLDGGFDGGFGGGDGFGGQPQQSILQQTYDFGLPSAKTDQAGAHSIIVRKLYLGLTRPQNQQHRRSFDVVLDGTGHQAIQEEVDRYGQKAFDPTNISKLMAKGADFIRYSGTPEADVGIDNGWETERFRFSMWVDVYRNGVFQRTEFISGYTDEASVLNAGMISSVSVNPEMVFTINHVTEARFRQMDSMGNPLTMVSRAHSVVRNQSFNGLGAFNQQMYLTRPSDVLRAVDKVDMYRGMQEAAGMGVAAAMTYQDLDSTLTNVPVLSGDTNQLIPTFMSRTMSSLYQNSLSTFDPMNMDNTSAGSLASERIKDTPFSNSGFVHVINRRSGNGTNTTAQFTYGELLRLDPTIDDRTDVFGKSYETGVISIPNGNSFGIDTMGEAIPAAIHATAVAQTTLALMSMSGIATLAYHASNSQTGIPEVVFQACDGMDQDGLLGHRLEALKGRLIIECLNLLCVHQETFEIDVFADAFNDVYIQIYHDGVRRNYVVPAFASSSFAPVVTEKLDNLVGMAEAIHDVVDTCKQILNPGLHKSNDLSMAVIGNGDTRIGGLAGDY